MRRPLPRPTDVELSVLRVLWEIGPSTVRDVHTIIRANRGEDLVYTGVLKMMQTMAEKGLLTRDESGRSHVYAPAQPREHTLLHLLDDLLDRAFGGKALELMVTALSSKKMSDEEREHVAALLQKSKSRQVR